VSEELQNKLKSHQDKKSIQVFWAGIADLEVVSYGTEGQDFSVIENFLAATRSISSVPNSSVEISKQQCIPRYWIESVLLQSKMPTSFYLRMADFYGAGWVHIKCSQVADSLLTIWQNLSTKDIQIVSQDLSKVLVISQEEHQIEAFWQQL
jgi:hypothetical protein